ncbi:MAG: chemotaxis protein CheW [Xanthomonadales bacterium]|nr:chemotaxis protein CheW [Gammaproteobacteria bacterium]MBT8054277.1 chemotaxis protein CheW [Gammaproteobacteria bacterium]NND57530.1 chemotaxis protein CheW [Xanthomonadales bacterium]NNK51254.1 chemotaxis protein CheW [Xanthomonadales bacterium]
MARQTRTRKKVGAKKVLRRSGKSPEIHCMLIPADMETLILPITAMVEVIDFSVPQAMEGAPPWLLGQIDWESRQVPVFSFGALINGSDAGEVSERSKIMILKSLSDSARLPYLGLLLADLPRPTTIKESTLVETGDEKKSLGVFSRVTIEDQQAIIPDLDRLTHLVTHATFGALPITQLDS